MTVPNPLRTNLDYNCQDPTAEQIAAMELNGNPVEKDIAEVSASLASRLYILRQAEIRGPGFTPCPFGLPIVSACGNVGDMIGQMTPLETVPEKDRERYQRYNTRVYLYGKKGDRCPYADNLMAEHQKVNCDYGDDGAGQGSVAIAPSPTYPRAFSGLGSGGIYSYPIQQYSFPASSYDVLSPQIRINPYQ